MGLRAAFGGGIDWKTSTGEDRYRRGLYTTWRRSNPYPSMTTFDAPNREVCTVRRDRTNTPLQALVTLNDPVYVEAAQSLARIMLKAGDARLTVLKPDSKGALPALRIPPNSIAWFSFTNRFGFVTQTTPNWQRRWRPTRSDQPLRIRTWPTWPP